MDKSVPRITVWHHVIPKTLALGTDLFIRTPHLRQILINNPKGHCFGITMLCRVMPNSDPRDRFICPYLTLMIDSFSCILFCANA